MQEKILRAFLYKDKLKFNEIEKLTDKTSILSVTDMVKQAEKALQSPNLPEIPLE